MQKFKAQYHKTKNHPFDAKQACLPGKKRVCFVQHYLLQKMVNKSKSIQNLKKVLTA